MMLLLLYGQYVSVTIQEFFIRIPTSSFTTLIYSNTKVICSGFPSTVINQKCKCYDNVFESMIPVIKVTYVLNLDWSLTLCELVCAYAPSIRKPRVFCFNEIAYYYNLMYQL